MSGRTKRKLEAFDPNASDPDDSDFDLAAARPSPQKRRPRNQGAARSRQRGGNKRLRREYRGSDVDDDDEEIVSDDSFTGRSSSEEIEINPTTGRSVRRAAQKQVKYEESEEDAIADTPPESEDESPAPRGRTRHKSPVKKKQTLIVCLKYRSMPRDQPARSLRTRTGSKSVMRGKTPEVVPTRRSSRLSHDVEEPLKALTNSGKHEEVVRPGTRSPEPIPHRATRAAKGLRSEQQPSIIMEASQEASAPREESPGPLDRLLGGDDTQVEASKEHSPEPEAHAQGPEDMDAEGEDEDMEGVIQESQPEAIPDTEDEEEEEEGPITRGGRNLRPRHASAKRKRGGVDESSDFEPAADDEKEVEADEDAMSESDRPKSRGRRLTSVGSGSGSGRRSARIQAKTRQSRRGRRNSDSSEGSLLDEAELAEEAQELATSKRRRLSRRNPDNDLTYDTAPKLRERTRANVDYRIIRPEHNNLFDDEDGGAVQAERSRTRGGRAGYRSLFSNQGPFGGGLEGGLGGAGAVAGIDSDSSDDEIQKAPKGMGGMVGMTPTAATGPGFAFPQTHNADAQQAAGAGGGPANFGKVKDRKALADADPLGVDPNVDFSAVGGLDDHINKLKEMVMLPLLYPEVFQRFKITPPRGVLFHGPPGTGKTLLARALASSVSAHGQKVTFYMRKGADALSKWVGEAERQLRLLFEEARKTQPSIIFFDEIDGLAPVRSSKQEQIHASIVATLLALMDGMDGRGQVIVIGATNRPDSVDPALRRPGRFDREFYFPLPDVVGRRSIIDIHTKNWDPPLQPDMKDQLAELTKGYGGADLRALCTEAALNAVQGTFPQIYQSERKLLIDPANIKVMAKDFMVSVNKIVPSSQRTASSTAAPLSKLIEPLLRSPLAEILKRIDELVPRRKKLTALEEAQYDDREDEKGFEREMTLRQFESSRVFRPRLLISGLQGMGQQYLGAALLSKIEGLHVQSFDLPTISEDPTRTPEAAIIQLFAEVRRHKPSVIYIPAVDVWYENLPPTAIKTFKQLLRTIGANEPILLLAYLELEEEDARPNPQMMQDLFSFSPHNRYNLKRPDEPSRREFFNPISHYIAMSPKDFPDPDNRKKRELPELEFAPVVAPAADPREEAARAKQQLKQDRMTLNKLKVIIQPIMDQLKKTYRKFFKPVIDESHYLYLLAEEDPNHFTTDLPPEQQQEQGVFRPWERSKDARGVDVLLHVESGNRYYNLDLLTIEKRLSNGYYKRPKDFLADIKTLGKDARTIGDQERTLKSNEMVANVEVDIDTLGQNWKELFAECDAVYFREQERLRKQKEKLEKLATIEGQQAASASPGHQQQSLTAAETSGPITLGEPIPGPSGLPPVTPMRPLTPGTSFPNDSGNEGDTEPQRNGSVNEDHTQSQQNGSGSQEHTQSQHNGASMSSKPDEDAEMTDSPNFSTQSDPRSFEDMGSQTQPFTQPFTQTQRSQASGRTFMAPNSTPADYHNSASTTTSGNKTSDNSSGLQFNTQSSNGISASNLPDFSQLAAMAALPPGSQVPDTQEIHFPSSEPSQHSPPPPSQSMPAPGTNIASLLNREVPILIYDQKQVDALHDGLVEKTSGCSVEQLEQINAALMDALWDCKNQWNRNVVVHKVQDAFNLVIREMQTLQTILQPSQEEEPDNSPFFRKQYGGRSAGHVHHGHSATANPLPPTQEWATPIGRH